MQSKPAPPASARSIRNTRRLAAWERCSWLAGVRDAPGVPETRLYMPALLSHLKTMPPGSISTWAISAPSKSM